MADFGIFEAAISSEAEVGLARQAAIDSLSAAIYDVREKLGPALFAASSLEEFRDRVAMMKNDQSLFKIISAHTPPVTGTVRRIVGKNSVLEKEFKAKLAARPSEGDWDRIMDQPAPSHWQKILDDQDAREKSHAEDWKRSEQMENANREWQDSVRGKKRDEYGDIVGRRRQADSWQPGDSDGWLDSGNGAGSAAGSSLSGSGSSSSGTLPNATPTKPSGSGQPGGSDYNNALDKLNNGIGLQFQDRPAGGGFNGGGDGTGGGGGVAKPGGGGGNGFNIPGLGSFPGGLPNLGDIFKGSAHYYANDGLDGSAGVSGAPTGGSIDTDPTNNGGKGSFAETGKFPTQVTSRRREGKDVPYLYTDAEAEAYDPESNAIWEKGHAIRNNPDATIEELVAERGERNKALRDLHLQRHRGNKVACYPGCEKNEAHAKKFHKDKEARRRQAGRLDTLQGILDNHQAQKIDGMLVDAQTANLLLQLHSKGNDKTKNTIETAPLDKVVNVAWGLTKKGEFSGTQNLDQTFKPSDDELVPEDNFDGYLNSVDQGAPGAVERNFTSAALYRDWCEANDLSPIRLSSLDAYADRLSDGEYMRLASHIQRLAAGDDWPSSHNPATHKGQPKSKLKDVTARQRMAYDPSEDHQSKYGPRHQWSAGDNMADHGAKPALDYPDWGEDGRPTVQWDEGPSKGPGKHRSEAAAGDHWTYNSPGAKLLKQKLQESDERNPDGARWDEEKGWHDGVHVNPVKVKKPASVDPMRAYINWCQYNGLQRISARNVARFAGNDTRLCIHLAQRMRNAIHTARRRQAATPTVKWDNGTLSDGSLYGEIGSGHYVKVHPNGEWVIAENWPDNDPGDGSVAVSNQELRKGRGKTQAHGAQQVEEELTHWPHVASRRTAAPDYLQKADDALTQLLNQKAEEFQQTIAPLQQALVTVQQAEQLQQQANPMNVLPPPGTVNVLPGQAAPGQVGQSDPSGGLDPNAAAAAALAAPPGGDPGAAGLGAAPGGGIADDQSGPPPAAGQEGALPPELLQQTARRRQAKGVNFPHGDQYTWYDEDGNEHGRGDRREELEANGWKEDGEGRWKEPTGTAWQHGETTGWTDDGFKDLPYSDNPYELDPRKQGRKRGGQGKGEPPTGGYRTATSVFDLWNRWKSNPSYTQRGGEPDYEAFAKEFGVGQQALNKLRQQHSGSRAVDHYLAWCNAKGLQAGHQGNLTAYATKVGATERKRLAAALRRIATDDNDPYGGGFQPNSDPSQRPPSNSVGKGGTPAPVETPPPNPMPNIVPPGPAQVGPWPVYGAPGNNTAGDIPGLIGLPTVPGMGFQPHASRRTAKEPVNIAEEAATNQWRKMDSALSAKGYKYDKASKHWTKPGAKPVKNHWQIKASWNRLSRYLTERQAAQHDYDPDNPDQEFAPAWGYDWSHESGPSGPPYVRPQSKGKHDHEARRRRASDADLLKAEGDEISTIGEYQDFADKARATGNDGAADTFEDIIGDEREHVQRFDDQLDRRTSSRKQAWMGGMVGGHGAVEGNPRLSRARGIDSGADQAGSGDSPYVIGRAGEERLPEGLRAGATQSNQAARSRSGGTNMAGRSRGATGAPSQRRQARQSLDESGLWDEQGERGRHGSSRHPLAATEDALSGRAFARGRQSHAEPTQAGMAGVLDVRQGAQAKVGWTGWGPSVAPKTRQVDGWEWNNHLNGYVSNSPQRFACDCGSSFDTPTGFRRCAGCGKQWNSYIVGTGGSNREAAAEKFIVREIPVRPGVIVANKNMEADIPLADGEMGTRQGGVRGFDSGPSAELGPDSASPQIRAAYFAGASAEAQRQWEDEYVAGVSRRQAGSGEPYLADSQSGGLGVPGSTGGARSAASQQRPARQSTRESGLRNPAGQHAGHGGSRTPVAAEQDPLPRRASARGTQLDSRPTAQGMESVSGVHEGAQLSAESPRVGFSNRGESVLPTDHDYIASIYKLTDPGELEDGEDDGRPTMKATPSDWHRRDKNQRWTKAARRG